MMKLKLVRDDNPYDENTPYYFDLNDQLWFTSDELKEIYNKLGKFLTSENRPETRCDKCVYELNCQMDKCIYPNTKCKHYKRDAKDGGHYG